ncbi:hypothetical protein [Riemerella columbipharyngis]|uniref:Uncharacterized protein n=1 Tax=Riemerella columbipharyngis TaxID=1071918 RepID=A0A1G7EYG0_9FLAO|nr:hypothetical protein [Riemerella columbipharyngis]SDE68506.1 hypothetical protein SAMN05421544_11817 [Riemerella columbipharyngis]
MNNRFQKLTALLALGEISLNAGLFGNKKPFAKLDEDQLQIIEDALKKNDTTALEESLKSAETKVSEVENAVEQALEISGLKAGDSLVASIVLLGETCKQYGESKDRHSLPENSGKEEETDGLIDGYINPNHAHNKILKQIFNGK